ncbi:MAG: GNAT family N-acetyltransferase [Pseudoflavonifractor sp.]|nr:GNAT family N-acetyltransferase [Alloprevotella sp.]MCM1117179.1 GNAT family N-acetyltransferase [Pseudoflavonifractor sp.]
MTVRQPLLSDGIVTLRAPEPTDIDAILAWENDTREWASAATAAPYSRRNIEDYVLTYDPDIFSARQMRFIIEVEREAIGAIDLYDFDPINRRAGMGIVVDPRARRRGYALRAHSLMATYAATHVGIHQLWAIASAANTPSRRMLAAAGYATAGHLRSWLRCGESYTDAYIYQQLL